MFTCNYDLRTIELLQKNIEKAKKEGRGPAQNKFEKMLEKRILSFIDNATNDELKKLESII